MGSNSIGKRNFNSKIAAIKERQRKNLNLFNTNQDDSAKKRWKEAKGL
jgi:hypothetical protein